MTLNYIDIFIIVISALMILSGFIKGFIVSVIELVRFFVGVPISIIACNRFADPVYNGYVRDWAVDRITDGINNAGGIDTFVSKMTDGSNPVLTVLTKKIASLSLDSASVHDAAVLITDKLLSSFLMSATKVVLFLAVIILFYFVTGLIILIVKHFSKKDKTPLRSADRLLGGMLSLIKAALVLVAFCALADVLVSLNITGNNSFLKSLDNSVIIDFINNKVNLSNYLEV